jgi:hypothetical protein
MPLRRTHSGAFLSRPPMGPRPKNDVKRALYDLQWDAYRAGQPIPASLPAGYTVTESDATTSVLPTYKSRGITSVRRSRDDDDDTGEDDSESGGIVKVVQSDAELLKDVDRRFMSFKRLIKNVGEGRARALCVSAHGGVGKSYTVEEGLTAVKDYLPEMRFQIVSGAITAPRVYEALYHYRGPHDVTVFDDSDDVFDDNRSLNILKHATNSRDPRTISYKAIGTAEGMGLQDETVFQGTIIFLTNINIQEKVDLGRGRNINDLKALNTRWFLLDLKLHDPRTVFLYVKHVCEVSDAMTKYGLTKEEQARVLTWMGANRMRMKELSIRTAERLAQTFMDSKRDKFNWMEEAAILFLR